MDVKKRKKKEGRKEMLTWATWAVESAQRLKQTAFAEDFSVLSNHTGNSQPHVALVPGHQKPLVSSSTHQAHPFRLIHIYIIIKKINL